MRRGFLVQRKPKSVTLPPQPPPNLLTCPTLKVPDLPPEITDRILDHLHHDLETLRKCSLVCKEWLPRSRHHAFRRVTLRGGAKLEQLQEIINTNPSLAHCIRELTLKIGNGIDPTSSWLTTDLPPLIKRLPPITRLEVDGEGVCYAEAFRPFPSVRQLFLQHCFFHTFNEFAGSLCYLPSLQSFSCWGVMIGDSGTLKVPPATDLCPRPKIRKMEIYSSRLDSGMFVDWCIQEGITNSMEEITVWPMQRLHLHNVGRLVKAIGPNLIYFNIALISMRIQGGYEDVFPSSFSLAWAPNLQCISFGTPGGYSSLYHTNDQSPIWIQHMLSQIQSKHLVKIIFWISQGDETCITRGEWDGIVDLLKSKQFASVKKMEMRLTGEPGSAGVISVEKMETYVKDRSKKLIDDGVLTIHRSWERSVF